MKMKCYLNENQQKTNKLTGVATAAFFYGVMEYFGGRGMLLYNKNLIKNNNVLL